jgi:poly-gamma-glutamate capsule biosynthesis protein CapA/YwtB (metallophosphatase superfamily)
MVVTLLGATALSACSPGEAGTPGARGATPTPKPTPAPTSAAPRRVTLVFGGDVHFEGGLRARLGADPRTAMGPIAKTLRAADLAMVNLESAVNTGGVPAPDKEFRFRAPPSAFTALRAAGVDVATLANNHGMDFMEPGLRDTLAASRRSRFPVVGIGADARAAYRPYVARVNGSKIAIFGATQVVDDHLLSAWTATSERGGLAVAKSASEVSRLARAVRRARADADAVVVYLHWGQELASCPLDRQQVLARQLVEAGADAVVGGHAHVPLGGGYLGAGYVHYGLGNLVFSSAGGPSARTGLLQLTLTGRRVTEARWRPATISGGLPRLLTGARADRAAGQWERLRRCAGLRATPR